jgi:hypothetical protein
LRTSLEQSMAIQVWVAEGMDRAASAIREVHAFDTDLAIEQTRCDSLSEMSSVSSEDSDEFWRACVLKPLTGEFGGVVLFSMDSEEALAWVVADGAKRDIVESFLQLGERVVDGLVESATHLMDIQMESGGSRFREDSITGCLLSTHAPPDTVAIGNTVKIRSGGCELTGHLHILMEPKSMSQLLRGLSVSFH